MGVNIGLVLLKTKQTCDEATLLQLLGIKNPQRITPELKKRQGWDILAPIPGIKK